MKLDELIEYLKYSDLINFKNVEITGISYNLILQDIKLLILQIDFILAHLKG